jgi:phage head maturation protease
MRTVLLPCVVHIETVVTLLELSVIQLPVLSLRARITKRGMSQRVQRKGYGAADA